MSDFSKSRGFERAHPATIIFNLGRVVYLIIIPVLRGFISAFQGGFARWLSGAWVDVLVFLAMLGIATGAWFILRFRCELDKIEIRSGFINIRNTSIPWDKVTAITLIRPFYLRLIRALRFRADTLGGSFKDADFSILLTPKQARGILKTGKSFSGKTLGRVYQPSTKSILALSLLTSNSFGGILFMSTFISQSGKLLGKEFPQMIIGTFEEASRNLAFGIPPAAAAIAYILIAGWFISFLLTFMRYKDFTLTRRINTFCVSGGMFTHREYYVKYSDVNFIDIRQSIPTKLLRLNSLYISAVGYGKQKNDISCIVPAEPEVMFEESCKKIFPHIPPSPRAFTPERRGVMRFLGSAITAVAAIIAAIAVLLRLFPAWDAFIRFVGLMACVPALFFLIIQIIDFNTCGISFANGSYTIRYSSGLSLHTVVIPGDKVARVELRQGFFQKFGKYCDLIICSKAEGISLHRCRGLVKSDLMKLFHLESIHE